MEAKETLTNLLDYLSLNLQDLPRIMSILRAEGVLSETNEQEITAEATSYMKNKALIDCLMKKSGVIHKFLGAVLETKQSDIYEIIVHHPTYRCMAPNVQEVSYACEWIVPQTQGFPQKGCVRARDIAGLEQQKMISPDADAYVALWLHPGDGEAVFGCAWKESGRIKARFTFGLKVWTAEEVQNFKILRFCDNRASQKYRWVQGKYADKKALLTIQGYTPAVAVIDNYATIGKAVFQPEHSNTWVATCEYNKETFHKGEKFLNDCFLLTMPEEARFLNFTW